MATVANGAVSVSYRPLTTMDELHVLLLAAVTVETTDLPLLEQVFSLPANVIAKELAILEAYGLVQKVEGKWLATSRGRQISAVWTTFDRRKSTEVGAIGRQWLLGPGESTVDEMIRDKNEIDALARGFGVAEAGSAENFLRDRRRAAERFDWFVLGWPSHQRRLAEGCLQRGTGSFRLQKRRPARRARRPDEADNTTRSEPSTNSEAEAGRGGGNREIAVQVAVRVVAHFAVTVVSSSAKLFTGKGPREGRAA